MRTEDNELIHHTKRGRERKDYRQKIENWENAQVRNRGLTTLFFAPHIANSPLDATFFDLCFNLEDIEIHIDHIN